MFFGLCMQLNESYHDGLQKLRSHLRLFDSVRPPYCLLPVQSWNTWSRVAMSYHNSGVLPGKAAIADQVPLTRAARGDHLLHALMDLAEKEVG